MINSLLIAAFLCTAAGIFGAAHVKGPLSRQRRFYWSCTALAGVLLLAATYPDMKMFLGLLAMLAICTVCNGYFYTPYIKFRGRIRAISPMYIYAEDPEKLDELSPPEMVLTAPTLWWIIAGWALAFDLAMVCSYLPGRAGFSWQHDHTLILIMLGFCVVFATGLGYGEAKLGRPVARGQQRQFLIASVSSVGLFAALYLTARRLTLRAIAQRPDG